MFVVWEIKYQFNDLLSGKLEKYYNDENRFKETNSSTIFYQERELELVREHIDRCR